MSEHPYRGGRASARSETRSGAGAVTVTVVVPALNEAANLPHVLGRIPVEYELVIVDGHSTDGTAQVALACRPDARIIRQSRRGKGNALSCGFAAAEGDIVVMLDADGSARPEEIPNFVDALLAGADFAKGSRFAPGGGSADITPLRRAGNAVLGSMVNRLFDTSYTDLCYGYNAIWRRCLPLIALDCDGFEVETMMNIRVANAGLRVTEVASFEDVRLHGKSNLRTIKDGWRVLVTILRERRRQGCQACGDGHLAVAAAPAIERVNEEDATHDLIEVLRTRVRQSR